MEQSGEKQENMPTGERHSSLGHQNAPEQHSASSSSVQPVDQVLNEELHDRILECLSWVCEFHDLPYSEGTAIHSLHLGNGKLSENQIPDAAENLGIQAQRVNEKPSNTSPVVCPFVVMTGVDDALIVSAKDNRNKQFEVITRGGATRTVSFSDLDALASGALYYLTPTRSRHNRGWGDHDVERGHWLWSVVGRFWSNWTNVIVATFLLNLLGLALPLFVMNVYDRVIPNNSIATLWALAAGVVVALIFDFALRMLRSLVIDNSGRRIDMRVSSVLFRKSLDVKMSERGGRSGDLANSIREFESVRDFFTSASISSLIDLAFIGLFLLALWLIVGPLALVPLAAVPLVIGVTLLLQMPLAKSVQQAQSTTANRHSVLVESLVSIETVKALRAEGILQKRWDDAVAGSVRASSATKFWSSLAIWFCTFVQQAVSVVVIVWGVFLVAEQQITIGALIASNILAGRVLAPLGGVAMTLARAQQSFASLRQLNHLMLQEGDHGQSDALHRPGLLEAELDLKNVSFSYGEEERPVLNLEKLSIEQGERVGIIGKVGSGKSTLGKLLSGLYDNEGGQFLIGGHEIGQYSKADLREAVVYAGQESELFSGSLLENVTLSRALKVGDLNSAMSASGVAAFAQAHPQGLELQVGERGRNLSGGQRQAVCLARAMVLRPRILFLDEPTSAMDNASEAAFIRGLDEWAQGETTVLVATHRLSLLEFVDRVIVMDEGRIMADGPKDKVLEKLKQMLQKVDRAKRASATGKGAG